MKRTLPSSSSLPRQVIVIDNGADQLRIGLAGEPDPRLVIPNCTAKLKGQLQVLVGDEIDHVNNTANLQYSRPFDRGYLTNWEPEYKVWQRVLSDTRLKVEPKEHNLLVTEPPFTPNPLPEYSAQVVFEEFGFASCCKRPAACLSAYKYSHDRGDHRVEPDCVTVVDSGFSFTHVVPFYKGRALQSSIRRINVGGKLLTNYLKEAVSYRQWNMMDEFQLVNDAKEALCYVALDFEADMVRLRQRKNRLRREFVLPDFQTTMRGYAKQESLTETRPEKTTGEGTEEQQTLVMEVERFAVPELLFNPSDVGLSQAGIPEAIHNAISACDLGLQGSLYHHIILTGGNARFPGMRERVEREIRAMAPDYCSVSVVVPEDPSTYAWRGGSLFAPRALETQRTGTGTPTFISRQDYEEWGYNAFRSEW